MLYNKTTKEQIMARVAIASTFFSTFKGLMFESRERFNYAMVFVLPIESRTAATIHTFFVFFPIDVVFLNKQKKVLEVARAVKPFNPFYMPKKPARYFIELPAGKAEKIRVGDFLEWENQ